jgi:uncharacterized RDD family membrane protein YckC
MGFMERISRTEYVRSAIAEKADLSAFKARPSLRVKIGIAIVLFSYVIGWPAVAVLGYLSVTLDNGWLVAIGGPLIYGFSHLVFLLGIYLSGYDYTKIFLRWAVRVVVEKWMPSHPEES